MLQLSGHLEFSGQEYQHWLKIAQFDEGSKEIIPTPDIVIVQIFTSPRARPRG